MVGENNGIEIDGAFSICNPKDLEKLISDSYRMDTARYFTVGWDLFKSDLGGFLSFGVLFFLINMGLSFIPIIGNIATMIVTPALAMGFFIVAAKKLKQEPTRFEDFFKGFNYFIPLALVGLVSSALITVGLVLLVLPGIYLAVGYLFAYMLVVDRKLPFWDAMESSRKIANKNWFTLFGFFLALLAINIVGAMAFMIGLAVTTGISFCILTAAYEDIIGIQSTDF